MRERRNLSALLAALAVLVVVGVAYGVSRGDGGPSSAATSSATPTPAATPTGLPTDLPTLGLPIPFGMCGGDASSTATGGEGIHGCTFGLESLTAEQLRQIEAGSLPPRLASAKAELGVTPTP